MPDETAAPETTDKKATEPSEQKVTEPQVVAPVPVKKLDPVDEVGETLDQFFKGVQIGGVEAMRVMVERLKKKADDVITKLDVGDPPKKQG